RRGRVELWFHCAPLRGSGRTPPPRGESCPALRLDSVARSNDCATEPVMTLLCEHLRALLGNEAIAAEIALLTAAEARAAKLPRHHGVLYSEAVKDEIDQLDSGPTATTTSRSAYYLGLQVGWRVAQRLR